MTADVVDIEKWRNGEAEPVNVLQDAIDEGVRDVVVIAIDADGDLYLASASPNPERVNWLLDRAKHGLQLHVDSWGET